MCNGLAKEATSKVRAFGLSLILFESLALVNLIGELFVFINCSYSFQFLD